MAKILTDRTSVRVIAKSETDANNQKKNDANNIAKALGKDGDLDDTKASSVASKLGNTITDENGTTWAKSSEVAAAAKELDGAFEEKIESKGIIENGKHYGYSNPTWWTEFYSWAGNAQTDSNDNEYFQGGHVSFSGRTFALTISDNSRIPDLFYSSSPFAHYKAGKYGGGVREGDTDVSIRSRNIISVTINGTTYTAYEVNSDSNSNSDYNDAFTRAKTEWVDADRNWGNIIPKSELFDPSLTSNADYNKHIIATLYGVQETGGSKIDTSKSEDQIKDELESKAWKQGKAAKINPVEPNETYIAVTDANGNPLYFLGT